MIQGWGWSASHHRLIVQMTSQPKQVKEGLWNCSGPSWPDFRHHFFCNRRIDCADAEDEYDCPYTLCADGGTHF